MTLVERAGLWTEDRKAATREAERRIKAAELSVVRLAFADQHGVLRGKTLTVGEIDGALKNGVGVTATMLLKDTSHRTVFPVWQPGGGFGMKELEGAADVVMLPDPTTFRVLPWAPHSGWMLCDLRFADGRPMPFCTRHICRKALETLGERGYDFVAGLEVEFHLFKLEKAKLGVADAGQPGEPPDVSLLNQGYQFLTEQRYDEMDPILEILRTNIVDLGLPLRSIEVEFGPSQVEFTFRTGTGLGACRRHGAVPQRHQAGRAASWLSRHLHVPPQARQRHVERLASAPVADGQEEPRQHLHGRARTALAGGHALHGGATRPCPGRCRLQHADHERLQALPPLLARSRPRHLGTRQSGSHGPGAGRSGRSRDAPREPDRRAGRQSLPLCGEPDRERAGRARPQARSRPIRRHAL